MKSTKPANHNLRIFFSCLLLAALLAALPLAVAAQGGKKPLSIEIIFGGSLSSPGPSGMRWSPDGKQLAYFQPADSTGNGRARDLWVMETATGEKKILLTAAKLRELAPAPEGETERERTFRTRFGVASFTWSPDSRALLFVAAGQLLHYDIESGEVAALDSGPAGPSSVHVAHDPRYSPDSKQVAFVLDHDIWVSPVDGSEAKQYTFGGNELLLHGEFDWVYQEELRSRGSFFSGYAWSPDSAHIAFLETDESVVPTYPITEMVSLQATADFQHYPKPGDPNPKVRVGIVNIASGKTVWIDRAAEYIPRIGWADATNVAVQLLNRRQNELEMIFVDPATGRSRSVLTETDEHWVEVNDNLRFLSDGSGFLWTSERSGFRHIYLYGIDGKLQRQLTEGDWQISGVSGLDEAGGWVYFTSNEANPIGSDLYRVKLDGAGKEQITDGSGTHGINMNSAATAYLDRFSSFSDQGRTTFHHIATASGNKKAEVFREPRSLGEFDLVEPELVMIDGPDGGKVRLHILKPRKLRSKKWRAKYPVLVYIYGMPGTSIIRDSWGGRRQLWHQFLVQQGYVVVTMDDSTGAIWGHKYAVRGYRNIGPVAVKDHAAGVEYLKTLPYVDPDRFGVWGWSGGGFTTTFHMTHTKLFKAGIAGAPVTDWMLYDSIYTERYMGVPEDDPEAYVRTSSVKAAENYSGRMMIIFGTHDDNVHPQNTIQLIDALIKNEKQFDLLVYPNKTHGITGRAHTMHLYTRMLEFLEMYLKGF